MIRTFVIAAAIAAAAIGAAPAANADPTPFPNCKAAADAGMYNIPSDSPYYGPWLDSDHDGIGCEKN